jgi:hypothetical protein
MTNHLITTFILLFGLQSFAQWTPFSESEIANLNRCGNFSCADSNSFSPVPSQKPPMKVDNDPLGKRANCERVFATAPYARNTYKRLEGFTYDLPAKMTSLGFEDNRPLVVEKDGFTVVGGPVFNKPGLKYTLRHKLKFNKSADQHVSQVDIFDANTEIVGARWKPSNVPSLPEFDTSVLMLQLDNGAIVSFEKPGLDLYWDGSQDKIGAMGLTNVVDANGQLINEFDCGLSDFVGREISVINLQVPKQLQKKH